MIKKAFIFGLLYAQLLYAHPPLERYLSYIQNLSNPSGNHKEGEIELVTDPKEIARIQKVQQTRLLKKGFSEKDAQEFSQVGILTEDQYWILIRDAVLFPHGVPGTYDRLLLKSRGVAVLPILPSGKIALVLNYRHATRSWELELPRGGVNPQESYEAAALRELKEETGLGGRISYLGEVASDTGIIAGVVPVYAAKITSEGITSHEFSEAIAGVLSFTKEQIKKGLVEGSLEVVVEGKKKQVPLRDAFLTFALLQAELRQLF